MAIILKKLTQSNKSETLLVKGEGTTSTELIPFIPTN
jgi:hypothetical protein